MRDSLRRNGYPDSFTRAFRNTEQLEFSTVATIPDLPVLIPQTRLTTPTLNLERPMLSAVRSAVESSTDTLIVARGRECLDGLADSDAAKGWVATRFVRSSVRRDRIASPTLSLLIKVSKGEIAATPEDRLEARWMAADSWHYFIPSRVEAYQAYQEILKHYPANPEIRARSMVESAACLLELTSAGKAYHNEVQRACKQIEATVPPRFRRVHATAAIMYAESKMLDGETTAALSLFLDFENRFPGRVREQSIANELIGTMLARQGRWQEAIPYFERNLNQDFSDPKENMYMSGKMVNMKERSAVWLRSFAHDFNDQTRKAQYDQYLAENYHLQNIPAADEGNYAFPHEYFERVND